MASSSREKVPAHKLVQQAVHDYYIRTPDADKMFDDDDFELLLEVVRNLPQSENVFKDIENYPQGKHM